MATKNRNGKPTEFQKNKLRELGFTKRIKTYREAENAIKRLRRIDRTGRACGKQNEVKSEAKPVGKIRSGFIVVSAFIPVAIPEKKEKR